ncbi:MAG: hypothetical protein E7288_10570 [Lachnospiraceae bacterium]|nr:hypothetical protein [Lachnospiraceae bacterium]
MKKQIMRMIAGVLCAVMLLGDGSLAYATSGAADLPEEVSESVAEENSEEASEEVSETLSEENSEATSEDTTEEVSEEAKEEISEDISEVSSEELSEDVSEEISEDVCEDFPEETSEEESTGEEKFPGMGESYVFSAENQKARENLQINLEKTLGGIEGENYVEGEILVSAADREEAENFAAAFGGNLREYVAGVAVIELNADGANRVSVEEAVLASANPENLLPPAWPNTIYHLLDADPALNPADDQYQWHHDVVDSKYPWKAEFTGNGVKVAVLDTGLRAGHEDIHAGAYHVTSDDKSAGEYRNTVDDKYTGHGTHVCGIIGATKGNGKGGAGIAPDAYIYSCNVFNYSGGASTDDILEGIAWAIEQKVDIINMSLGDMYYNGEFEKAVKEAYEAGIAVFCGAGNTNTNGVFYPACFEHSISIAALDIGLQKASFSNYGDKVRYAFPGVNILSTIAGYDTDGDGIMDELCTDGYAKYSGTSMSSPVAAGVAAVTLEYATSLGMLDGYVGSQKVDKLLEIMDSACLPLKGEGLGKGVVSLSKVIGAKTYEEKPNAPYIMRNAGSKYLTDHVNVEVFIGSNQVICYTLDGSKPVYKDGTCGKNTIMEWPFGNLAYIYVGHKRNVALKMMAVNMETGLCSDIVTEKYVFEPKVKTITLVNKSGKVTLSPGESVSLTPQFYPDIAKDKAVEWLVADEETDITVNSKGVVKVKKNAEPGEYYIIARMKNNKEVSTSYRLYVEKPSKMITSITSEKTQYVIEVNADSVLEPITVNTIDGSLIDPQALNWQISNPDIVSFDKSGEKMSVFALKAGKTRLVGTATDGSKKKITIQITVLPYIYLDGVAPVITKGSNATYNVLDVDGKKLKASSYDWSVEPAGQGVSVRNGKVKVDKDTSLTEFVLTATHKENKENYATYFVQIQESKVKSISVAKEYRNLVMTRDMEGTSGKKEVRIPIQLEGGTMSSLSAEAEKWLVNPIIDGNELVIQTGNVAGTDTVMLKALDGSKKSVKIKVKIDNPVSRFSITYPEGRTNALTYKKSMQLLPCFGTEYGINKNPEKQLKWTSSDPSVIKVDQKGKVTAVAYEGAAVIMAESEVYGVYSVILISATDVVKKIWLQTEAGAVNSSGESVGALYVMADLQHRTEKDFRSTMLPASYYDAVDVTAKGDSLGFAYYAMSDASTGNTGVVVTYCANKVGNYEATVKLRDGNKAKGKFSFKIK